MKDKGQATNPAKAKSASRFVFIREIRGPIFICVYLRKSAANRLAAR